MNKKVIKAYRLSPSIIALIEKYAEKNDTTFTKIVEEALFEYFMNKKEL